jgi:hypothetical protein
MVKGSELKLGMHSPHPPNLRFGDLSPQERGEVKALRVS